MYFPASPLSDGGKCIDLLRLRPESRTVGQGVRNMSDENISHAASTSGEGSCMKIVVLSWNAPFRTFGCGVRSISSRSGAEGALSMKVYRYLA